MAKQPETLFREKVERLLQEKFPGIFIMKIQQLAKRGDPDLILCWQGHFVAWELKVKKNKATKLQKYKLDLISKAGGTARVVHPDNLDACVVELERMSPVQ